MIRFIASKALQLLLTLLIVSFITFLAFSVIPQDPARTILGPNASPEQVEKLRQELGLDQPLPLQYFQVLKGFATGDLGESVRYQVPVAELISQRLPVTLALGGLALLITLLIALPLGLLSAKRPGRFLDQLIAILTHSFIALPPFIIALLLTLLLGQIFGIFVVGNYVSWEENVGLFLLALLTPAVAIALPKIAMTVKFMRAAILGENSRDYVRTAQSHGLSDTKVLLRHIFPNALIPVLSVLALTATEILGGSLIVEQVFNVPGLGRLLKDAVSSRDFPLLQGIVIYLAAVAVFIYLLLDIINSRLDPRIRLK